MHTKTTKTLFAISFRIISVLMILSMLLSSVGITPAHAASPDTISGNAGVAGATITWNGSGSGSDGSTTADASGNYSFQVTYSYYWSGTVTPSKAGYTFSPSSRTYNFLTSDQTNQNYTATPVTYTISGSVGSSGGGATITYTGGSTTASGSGSYSFTVPGGWSGTVTPTKAGYTFTPASRTYSNVTANDSNENYTATLNGYTISGNAFVSSATITYTGGSTTANSSGDYSFIVSPGWSGTVTPSRTGFAFWPASRTYTNVTANQTAQNYTGRPTSFTFGSFGDSHNEPYFNTTADQLASLNPALVLGVGDVEDTGFATTQMNQVVGVLKAENLFNKTFMVRGNHDDQNDGSAAGWESYLETSPNIPTRPAYVANKVGLNSSSDNLTYSFDYGNSIFIGLDVPGDVYLLTQDKVDFLDARLTYAENAGLTHAFIYFHGPEYCVELEHCTSSARNDSSNTPPSLMNVINSHPIVSATFHGHEHVLSWTHMDNTRISDLTRSYEQFVTSPAGASSYDDVIYPDRVDAYAVMADDEQGFATINVNGLSFTVNFYKNGFTSPELLWSHTFSKVNTPPTISNITDQTTNEDTATGAIPFTVGDVELNPAYLTITAASSDLTLVPAGNISLGGSGVNRTIDILPAPNESGSATITVSVNDGNVTVDDTFVLTVSAVNDAPVADPQSVSMPWNTSTNIVLTGIDVEESPLTFEIVDNPAHGSLSGSGANRQYTPTAGYSGTDSFTFKAFDSALYSVPATVNINITAYTISGNAGVAGATLSYSDGTPKTVTADGSGNYSFQVPTGWSGTVTPFKAGYTFSPESMTYANVLADQTGQNYSTDGVILTISGYVGIAGATLSYTDGTPKTVTADDAGMYSLEVSYNWSGAVTPSKTGYDFIPASRTYTNLTENQSSQDYTITTARVWYVDKTNPACTDDGQVGSFAVPFCTISRGAYLAQPGQIVHVLHGTYAETVYPERSGTAGNPITYVADSGVTVTGRPEIYIDSTHFTQYPGFGLGSRNYIVIDGFTIDNTSQKGIYVDASNHVTIINNHVTRAGLSSQGHPYEQGIYTRNTSYSTISNNITDYNTCIGIRVVGGDHNLISNNTSFENFSLVETDAAGIELTGSSYNTVINNLVYSNEDSGINLYYWDGNGGSHHNLVIGNLSYENGDHGIDNYQSPNNTVVGNTIQGNGTVGINFEGNTPALGSFGAIVSNNIMSQNGTTPPSGSWGGNLRFDANSISGSTTDYNLFYRTDATVQIIWNNLNYTSLAAFKTAAPTQEVHGLEGNPLFVNPVAPVRRQTGVPYNGLGIFGNYYTSAGSPAIDSANSDAPSEQLYDVAGNSRIDDPGTTNTGAGVRTYDDRGAYEYLPAGPSLPVVTTQAVSNIALTTATGHGTIAATGLPNPTQHGVVWALTANPTLLDNKTVDGSVSVPGPFTSNITDLTPGTLYHVRAYATNDVGTVYGEDVTFTTLLVPAVTTQAVTNITATTAIGHGNVTALGVPNPTQHGVVWSTFANPTTADSKTTDGAVSAIGAFTSAITGLTPGTLYHVRAYATNDAATVYGNEVTFTTLIVPTVTTQAVSNILTTTAVGNGNVTFLGIPNPTQHGVVWATTANPTTANSKTTDGSVSATGAFTSTITGLTPNTLYHVRTYATNTAGTVYGEEVTFTTLLASSVTTQAVTNIATTTATGNGNVTVLGSSNPTEHGVVWSTSLNPTIADNKTTDGPVTLTGTFTSSITGLTPGTLYHVRAYATNAAGTSYGSDVTFTSLIAPSVTTQTVTNITQTTAMGNGTIVSLGVPNPTQYGFVWDINADPTVALPTKTEKGPATVTGAFTSNITGLALGQTYHVRAYATNAVGTAYGEDVVFTTLPSSSTTTTPVTNAGTGADVSETGTGTWINPGNITAADNTYATVTLSGATSHYLEGTNYGFAIPGNATINGIQVTIGRYESGQSSGNDVRDSVVRLMKSGTLVGSNKAATSTEWPTANTAASYGANNDLWGTTWTADDINATNFGVALSANSTNNRIAYVDTMQIEVTYTVSVVSSTMSVNCGAGIPIATYGSSITCVATVVRGSGTFTPTGNVNWTTNDSGSFATSPCVLSGSNGTATCSVTYTPTIVGSGSHLITATYAGDASFYSSNGNQTVTVNKKDTSVTPNIASKTYGEDDPALTGSLVGFLSADGMTAIYSRTAGENAGTYPISAVLSPTGVLANYNITYNPVNFTINKKAASVTPNAASKPFGAADPTLTGSLAGFLPVDGVTANYSRVAGETVEGSPYLISAELSPIGVLPNYAITYNTANFTITQAEYTLTVNIVGNGSVTRSLPGPYHQGDIVTLTAAPEIGWSFGSWSANVADGNVTIDGNTSVTATFTQDEYTLTIVSDHGIVTPDKAAPYHLNDVVELTAAADAGWAFENWTGDLVSSNSPDSVTIHGDTTVTANYIVVSVAPTFTSEAVISVDEDALYTYNITATDPNVGDTLTFTAPTKPAWLTFTDNGSGSATLTGTPTNAEVGSHSVVLHVSDGTLSADQSFSIAVANINDAPTFTSTAVTEADEDIVYTYDITVDDPDLGDTLTFSAPTKPEWLTLTVNLDGTATLTGTPTNAEVGIHNVTLRVNDGTVDEDQVFTIDVGNTNDGPAFASEAITSVDEDAVYTYNITATDPDAGDTLIISAPTLPAWLTLTDNGNGTATLAGTPANSEVGDHSVVLQVSDSVELASQPFTIAVANTNDAPVLTQPVDQNNVKGAVVSLQIFATDVDAGDTLTYSASGLPDGLSIDPLSGLISGTLPTTIGTSDVTVTVDDGNGGSDSKSFDWVVTEPTYILMVDKVGNGTVTPDKAAPYYLNDVVVLTALADAGWTFSGWSGACTGSGNTCSVTMDGDKAVTATFTQDIYTLTVNKVGNGTVTPDKAAPYHLNDVVILTVVADPGWSFSGWTGDCTGSGTCSITMDADKAVTATFTNTLLPGIADDIDALWSYSGDWTTYNGSGPYSDTLHYSGTIGDSAQIEISGGQQIKLTYVMGSSRGVTDVYIDNVKAASIDAYSSTFGWKVTWTSGVLTTGHHTVRLVHASGAYTDIDAIELLATLPTSLLPGIADDIDPLWSYSGDWTVYNGAGPSSNTIHYSDTIGDSAQIVINGGQQIKLTYLAASSRGITDVYIDDVKVASIDAYSPDFSWQKTWSSDILTSGLHTVRLVHASGAYVDIDAIEVLAIPASLLPGIADDIDPLWSYSGDWITYNGTGPSSNTLHYSITVGDSAQIMISGSQQIKLTYAVAPNRGVTDVYVDEVKVASIDAYSPSFRLQETWISGVTTTTGYHKVRFVHASGAVTDIDAIEAIGVFATPSLLPGIADDVDSLWSFSGDWTIYAGGGPYLNSLHYSSTIGDSAQISVIGGQQIKLTYLTAANRGVTDVYVDDVKVGSIDANSPIFSLQKTWTSGVLTNGLHTVRFVHASGAFIDIDAIEVLETFANPSLHPGIADDVDSLWSYSGDWTIYSGGGPYLDSLHYSSTIGDSAQIMIEGGQRIKLTYLTAANRGATDVYIDEVKVASIDANSPIFSLQETWTSDILTSGLHTVRFVHASGDYTDIDALEVLP